MGLLETTAKHRDVTLPTSPVCVCVCLPVDMPSDCGHTHALDVAVRLFCSASLSDPTVITFFEAFSQMSTSEQRAFIK